jgi:hypothetical protein
MPWLTWTQSAAQLQRVLLQDLATVDRSLTSS